MTIEEIARGPKAILTAYDIADVLGSDPDTIRTTARQYPERLAHLEPIIVGNRVKFSRARFLRWYYGGGDHA